MERLVGVRSVYEPPRSGGEGAWREESSDARIAYVPVVPEGEISIDDPLAEDVRELLERHLAFATSHTPPEDVHALDVDGLRDPAITFFSFRRKGELLGVGALKQLDRRHAELKSMHIVHAARGRGIGRAMLEHLGVARDRGVSRVSLETGSGPPFVPARSLYAGAGFRPCEPFADYSPSRDGTFAAFLLQAARRFRPPATITHYTDPACPFAFCAEPVRLRLRWHYGDQLGWQTRMIVLTLEPGHAEMLAEGAPDLQRRYGMPIDPSPYARPASCEPACRAVVAARLNAPAAEERLLRRLRVHAMAGGLLDEPELLAAAAVEAGLDPAELSRWCATDEVQEALQADIAAARSPSPAARALDHKLAGPAEERRYTAPSYEIACRASGCSITIPGFNPMEAYEVAIASLAPELIRAPKPATVAELLAWAGEPLATAEVAAVAQLDPAVARTELSRVARPLPAGADCYWELS